VPFGAKLRSLRAVILPMLLIVMILGSIFFGIATPTEAAAVGVLGAVLASAVRRRLTARGLSEAAIETLKATAMILWITIGAKAYVAKFNSLGGANNLIEFIIHLDNLLYAVLGAKMMLLMFI